MEHCVNVSNHCGRREPVSSRREFLERAGLGCGMLALADLLGSPEQLRASSTSAPIKRPHYQPQAKSVIWLFMEGGPSGVDIFDPKPELTKRAGQKMDI